MTPNLYCRRVFATILCLISIVMTGSGLLAAQSRPGKTVAPEAPGRLRLRLLAGGPADYWLYVNGCLMEAGQARPSAAYVRVEATDGILFYDAAGIAARVRSDGRLLSHRPGVLERMAYRRSFPLPAGEHVVEVVIPRPDGPEFPFIFRANRVRIRPGKTSEVVFDVFRPTRQTTSGQELRPGKNALVLLDRRIDELRRNVSHLLRDPAFNAFRFAVPGRGKVRVTLPNKYGGTREYDARQVRLVAKWLRSKYLNVDVRLPLSLDRRIQERLDQFRRDLNDARNLFAPIDRLAQELEQK